MRTENRYKYWVALPLLALAWNELVFYGGRYLARGLPQLDMSLPLDERIPFLPWTVLIYIGCFVFWAVNYVICARLERPAALRFYLADFLMKGICLLSFVVLPAAMERPEVTGGGIWESAVRLLYSIDEPNNLFPSLHCAVSWLCWAGIRGERRVPAWYRHASLIMAFAVALSTLTVKQHVIVDTISGIILAEAMWQLAGAATPRR